MKVKIIMISLLLSCCFFTQATEEVSTDFLDFLIEVEDATGDGFVTWLESNDEDEATSTND